MGVNQGLHQLGQMLGLMPTQSQFPYQSSSPTPFGPRSLLGPDTSAQPTPVGVGAGVPETVAAPQDAISVAGNAPPRMSPSAMGMPGLPAARAADAEATADLRQALKDKADMARDIYHHGSEFGTHGILRDVVGNVEDLGRRLLGFSPRYNDEKWSERAYGMTSDDPNVRAAAFEQAMQYNPEKTMKYRQMLSGVNNADASTAATAEYKNSQVQGRQANILSGLGQSLLNGTMGATPEQAQATYDMMRPALQAQVNKVYGETAPTLPAQYSDDIARLFSASGYTGSNVQRERASVLSSATQRELQKMRGDVQEHVANIRGEYQIQAANILANTRMSVADKERALKMLPVEETQTTEESGSIIHPTKTQTTTRSYAPGGQPSGNPLVKPSGATAAPQRKFYNGHWYVRGPNGEAVLAD